MENLTFGSSTNIFNIFYLIDFQLFIKIIDCCRKFGFLHF